MMPGEHEITGLKIVGAGGRLDVYVDGERTWRLAGTFVEKLGLAVGRRISSDELAELHRTVALQEAKTAGVRLLGRRARTERGLRERLLAKGLPEEAASEATAWLVARGYVDDEAYARDRAVSLRQRRLGSRAIEAKLVQEGVSPGLAREVLASQRDPEAETEQVAELVAQLNDRWGAQEWPRRRQRIYQYLARRGFPAAEVMSALEGLDARDDSPTDY